MKKLLILSILFIFSISFSFAEKIEFRITQMCYNNEPCFYHNGKLTMTEDYIALQHGTDKTVFSIASNISSDVINNYVRYTMLIQGNELGKLSIFIDKNSNNHLIVFEFKDSMFSLKGSFE